MVNKIATFAGGCFWCMVEPFESRSGILAVVSGYTGGHQENPTYEAVKAGSTGHTEAVQITYDDALISYTELLAIYWCQTDPTDAMGQFIDRGDSYRPEIFYHDDNQREQAEASKQALAASGRFSEPIVTQITAATTFYPAEDYHQQFYKKNPRRWQEEEAQGRQQFISKHWQS